MFDGVLTASAGVAAALSGAIWNTGGRAALSRRAMTQELDIADELPAGATKEALTKSAEQRALLYLRHRVGSGWEVRHHVRAFVYAGLSAVVALALGRVLDVISDSSALGILVAVIYVLAVVVLFTTVGVWATALARDDDARLRTKDAETALEHINRYWPELALPAAPVDGAPSAET